MAINSKLDTISAAMPIANQRRAEQQRAAQALAVQQAVAQQPQGASTVRQAQQVGAVAAQQLGKQQVQAGQQNLQQQNQLASQAVAQEADNINNRIQSLQQGVQKQGLQQNEQLFGLQQQLENEAFQDRIQFKYNELGRLEMNDRQLADYARASGIADEKMRNYAQTAQLAYQRDIQLMEQAARVIEEQLKFESDKKIQDRDQSTLQRLTAANRALQDKIARKQAELKNNSQIWSTVIGIVGGVVGGMAGGTTGATAGYSGGSAAGSAIGAEGTDSSISAPTEAEINRAGG